MTSASQNIEETGHGAGTIDHALSFLFLVMATACIMRSVRTLASIHRQTPQSLSHPHPMLRLVLWPFRCVLNALLWLLCRLPTSVLLFAFGMALAPIAENVELEFVHSWMDVDPHVILMLLLPPLLFESAYQTNWCV